MRFDLNTLDLAHIIVEALAEKKGEDILLIDISHIASFTSYFIICSGTSDRMLDSLANTVLEKVKITYPHKGCREGIARDGWLVIDYGSVVVHLFIPDLRKYYHLESLWHEGKVLLRVQ